jgi:hypothetical protein
VGDFHLVVARNAISLLFCPKLFDEGRGQEQKQQVFLFPLPISHFPKAASVDENQSRQGALLQDRAARAARAAWAAEPARAAEPAEPAEPVRSTAGGGPGAAITCSGSASLLLQVWLKACTCRYVQVLVKGDNL